MGGGTANLGGGGGSWWFSVSSLPDLLAGGGGGGTGPLLEVDGVVDSETLRGAAAGGGGGGALIAGPLGGADGGGGGGGGGVLVFIPCFACSCFKNSMIKSWFSRMKSSSRPWALRSSPKCSLHRGSKASRVANSEGGLYPFIPLVLPALRRPAGAAARGESGGVAVGDECLCPPNRPPKRPWCLWWCAWDAPPKGVLLVALLAFFSLSFIFLRNCLASFSSTKDKPAKHSSSSKVWKKTRSWL